MTPTFTPEPRTDALLAVVRLPAGIPVVTMGIGIAGAQNAALTAAGILAVRASDVAEQLDRYRQRLREEVEAAEQPRSPEADAAVRPSRARINSAAQGRKVPACAGLGWGVHK